jgi:hypothetical protein
MCREYNGKRLMAAAVGCRRCVVASSSWQKPFFATVIDDDWWNYEAGDRHAAP